MVDLSWQFLAEIGLGSGHPCQSHRHSLELAGERLNFVQLEEFSRQSFIGLSPISDYRVKSIHETSHQLLSNTSVLWRIRWVEFPLDPLFKQIFSQNLLITIGDVVQHFLSTGKKVCHVVGLDEKLNASPGAKPFNAHHTTTVVH